MNVPSRNPESNPGSANSWESARLILPYLRRHAPRVLVGFVTLIVVDFLQLVVPRYIKQAVDALEQGTATKALLIQCGGTILLIALVIGVLRFFWRNLLLGFSRMVETDLRKRLFAHILGLDRVFFQRMTAGEIMALATNDLSSVQMATGMGLVAFVDAVFMGLAALGFMAYINPTVTVIAVLPMPVLAILTRFISARVHKRFNKVQEQFATMTEFSRATFSAMRLIKAYNQEEAQSRRFGELGKAYVRDNLRLASVYGILFPVSGFIGNVSMLLVLYFGGGMTIGGKISAGDFVAFVNYLFLMTWPMMAMGWVADLFQRGLTSLRRIERLLEERPVLKDVPEVEGAPVPVIRGEIEVRGLSFRYPDQKRAAVREVDLKVPEGRFVGIVGRTGSGKTTLCHLLARLYQVEDGTLFFDGTDVNDLPLKSVRSAIAYVPQDITLFSETIAFNIGMGKPDASMEEIENAARAAAIHDEIVAMSEGYQTRIGEKGVKLSGGQRQRVAIARALLLDRPIIIIDDSLSAVDMETEHAIVRSIASYLRGRTCIVVSHRVAPLSEAQEIVVMEGGRIVERGTHEDLMAAGGFYATIHEEQTKAS